jgi:hypothetical protein
MKILLSWPYALGENNDPPDVIAVLLPTRALFARVLGLMRKAEELETQIDGFIRMDIQDGGPLFIAESFDNDTDKLLDIAEELDTGMFHEVDVPLTEEELVKSAEESRDVRIESCVAHVEKECVGWEFHVKYRDVSCYTGTLGRRYVEEMFKTAGRMTVDEAKALLAERKGNSVTASASLDKRQLVEKVEKKA